MKSLNLTLIAIGTFFCFLCPNLLHAQTIGFVQQNVIKVPGITNDSLINALTLDKIQTTRTYLDGLGRTIQTVAVQGSALNNKDIIQPAAWTTLGTQTKAYLPYVDNNASNAIGIYRSTAITDQASYYTNNSTSSNPNKVVNDSSPWSQQVFENSPLQRVLQAGTVGNGFQPGQHYKSVNYRSNTSADNVLQWSVTGTYVGVYAANALSVMDAVDEDSHELIVFKDYNGNVILKRAVSDSGNLDTYYIYDAAGLLIYTVPPKAVSLLGTSYSLTQTGVNKLIFQYTYDNLGRLIQKIVPGTGPVYIIYDPLNRPVLVQDGNLRNNNQWNYIKYDAKNHAIAQGIYTDASPSHIGQVNMQTYVSSLSYSSWFETRTGTLPYYTNTVFPTANQDASALEDLAYTYYDDYDLNQDANHLPDYTWSDPTLSGETQPTTLTRGLPTITRKRTVGLTTNIWLINVVFYDKRGNAIQNQSNNQLNYTAATGANAEAVSDYKSNAPDFTGKSLLMKTVKTTVHTGTSSTVSVTTQFTYDSHNAALASVSQSYNNGSTWKTIASYSYNEMGQLVLKKLGQIGTTSNFLQNVDYRYNIHGRLLSINNSTLANNGTNNSDSNDIFGMEFLYESPDISGATGSYTGDITEVKWIAQKNGSGSTMVTSSQRSYVYSYNKLNEVKSAVYADRVAGTTTWGNQGAFDEKNITYDQGGNIMTLQRNAGGQTIDNLTYTYSTSNPYQLSSVSDASTVTGYGFPPGLSGSYVYDANSGNLTTDPYKQLQLTYNELNKTKQITETNNTAQNIVYGYDGSGVVIRKQVNGASGYTNDYIDGFVYQNGVLSYFGMPEGRIMYAGSTYTQQYIITDQQGNARISFQDNGSGAVNVMQENSYYAFGMVMPTMFLATIGTQNNNLYNGASEWQNDYNNLPDYYQTYYRNYDAVLGRFISVDPKAESADAMTSYQYSSNNPVMQNDPNGDLSAVLWQEIKNDFFNQVDAGEYGHVSDSYAVRDGDEDVTQISNDQAFDNVSLSITESGTWGNIRAGDAVTAYINYMTGRSAVSGAQFTLPPVSNYSPVSAADVADAVAGGNASFAVAANYGGGPNNLGADYDWQDANQGGLTRAQEFGKYGRISWGYNIMAGASYGPAGGIVETGTVITDKGWARDYIAYYYAPGFSPPNGSHTFFYIRASDDNNPPVFSDWSGLAKGVSGSFFWIAGGAGMGSNYSVWSLGVSIAPAAFNFMKETNLTGGLAVGNTTWIGAPYRMPADEGMTRFYINEKMYYGGP